MFPTCHARYETQILQSYEQIKWFSRGLLTNTGGERAGSTRGPATDRCWFPAPGGIQEAQPMHPDSAFQLTSEK